MTTRQSTTLHMSGDGEDPNNGLAFSTIDAGDPQTGEVGEYEPVLEVWGTIQAPDGQVLTARMQVPTPDVRDLQAFLNDNYARNKAPKAGAEAALQTQIDGANAQYFKDGWMASLRELLEMSKVRGYGQAIEWAKGQMADFKEPGEPYPPDQDPSLYTELPGMWEQSDFTGGESDAVAQTPAPRQCAVIYNGVQCLAPEGHAQQHDFGPIAQHQPDVDLFQEQAAAIQAADAQVANPADAPRYILGPKNAAEQARKRRLKLELAFDDAAEKYKTDPHNPGVVAALNDAAVALHKREPDNSRVVNFLFDPTSAPAPVAQPEQHQRAELDSLPEAHFAPEPAQAAPNYLAQEAHPSNQQFAEAAASLPGVHLQDSVTMPPEQFQQAQADGNPAAVQAAQAFPCPRQASDGRPCQRPAGHEIELPNRPAVPHVYATTPSMLTQQPPTLAPFQVPMQESPLTGPNYPAPQQGNTATFGGQPAVFPQPHLQAVPDPQSNVAVMSFHEGEPGMPAAPAMPTWQAPQQ